VWGVSISTDASEPNCNTPSPIHRDFILLHSFIAILFFPHDMIAYSLLSSAESIMISARPFTMPPTPRSTGQTPHQDIPPRATQPYVSETLLCTPSRPLSTRFANQIQSVVPTFHEDGVSSSHWIAGTPFCAALPKDSRSTARERKPPRSEICH
jgi:hypothetical protein